MNFIDFLKYKDLTDTELLIRVMFSLLIGFIIGLEREYKNRPAGMRTHVLVCLGASTIALLEASLVRASVTAASHGLELSLSLGRMSAQVISGIGFLGAGTIFMAQKKVSGLTTAASLWNVACLGILIGFGYYWLASCIAVLVIVVLQVLGRVIHINAVKHVEVKYINRAETLKFINEYFAAIGVEVLDVDFHIEVMKDMEMSAKNLYTNIYTLHLPGNVSYTDIVARLSENQNIHVVRTRNA